jgi:DNA-binding NarL/FixJ family response regulator
MFAQALQVALDGTGDIKVVGVAASIAEGVDAARATLPEVILVDYRQPDGNGIDGTRALKAEHPSAKVVLLTATDSDAILGRAIAAGCCGFVTEDERLEHLAAAIRAAHLGVSLISPTLLTRLVLMPEDRTRVGYGLTRREIEVLQLIAEGLSNTAIAARLGIRTVTVRNYVQRVLNKLFAHSKLEAVAVAVRHGVIQYEAVGRAQVPSQRSRTEP